MVAHPVNKILGLGGPGDLVPAHINACVLMMAEKAADLIRGRAPLPPALDA
ncbi:MAG TPA: hypothetical protein VIY51_09705 [Xanthobacteraceae bacterium]